MTIGVEIILALFAFSIAAIAFVISAIDYLKAEIEARKLRKIIEELQEELFMMHKMFFDK